MRTARSSSRWVGVPGPGCVPGLGGCTWSWEGTWSWGEGVCSRGVSAHVGGVPGLGGCTWSQGVYLVLGGVPGLGGSAPGDVCSRGCTWSGTSPLCGQTHACKHITLPQLRLRAVISFTLADSGLSRRGSNPKGINPLPNHFFLKNCIKNLYSEPRQLGLGNTWEVLSSCKLHF